MTNTFTRLKALRYATMEQFQRGHFDFDHQMYEGLKSKYPAEAEQIKQLCLQSLLSSQELTDIERKVEDLQSRIEADPSQAIEAEDLSKGLEDEYYQHLKEMNWAIIFDIFKNGETSVKAVDSVSPDEAHDNQMDIVSEYIFHPAPGDWLEEEAQFNKTAAVDTSWMSKVLKVTEPGINVETPYGKVFVHPKKGRRYIKKNDGVIESLPRFLLSLNGVDLPKGTDIHHKDENKLNDAIDNYAYDEHHDHAREHMNFNKKKASLGTYYHGGGADFDPSQKFVFYSSDRDYAYKFAHQRLDGYIYTVNVSDSAKIYDDKVIWWQDWNTMVSWGISSYPEFNGYDAITVQEPNGDANSIVVINSDIVSLVYSEPIEREKAFSDFSTIEDMVKVATSPNPADWLSGSTSTPYYQNPVKGVGTGKGKDVDIHEIPEDELEKGMQTEMEEHNVSPEDGLAIAMDHEAESIDLIGEAEYYKFLPNIETMIKNDAKNKK